MMTVRFQSNEILTKKGFLAVWKTLEEPHVIDCGNCVFPFVFRFRLFDTCTSIDGDQPWCPLADSPPSPIDQGMHLITLKSYCSDTDSSCPSTPQMSTHTNNQPGNCCKFDRLNSNMYLTLNNVQIVEYQTEEMITQE